MSDRHNIMVVNKLFVAFLMNPICYSRNMSVNKIYCFSTTLLNSAQKECRRDSIELSNRKISKEFLVVCVKSKTEESISWILIPSHIARLFTKLKRNNVLRILQSNLQNTYTQIIRMWMLVRINRYMAWFVCIKWTNAEKKKMNAHFPLIRNLYSNSNRKNSLWL